MTESTLHPSCNAASCHAVYGLGVSGLAVMAFFKARGFEAYCWDDAAAARARARQAGYVLHDFTEQGLPESVGELIISPGIPWNGQDPEHPAHRLAELAAGQGVRLCCDVEWLLSKGESLTPSLIASKAVKLAVSGTNGKTSVVSWLEVIMGLQGHRARALGNNGVAALGDHAEQDTLIFELSSYQLDLMQTAAFDRVLLLNISPDHLERYGRLEVYRQSKAKLLELLAPESLGVVMSIDDSSCRVIAARAESVGIPIIRFSLRRQIKGGVYLQGGQIIDHRGEEPLVVLDGACDPLLDCWQHMRNLTAVYALLCDSELPNFADLACQAVRQVRFAHRQDPIGYCDNLLFVDDSKATNPIAAADALRQFRRIHWIAGGQAKVGGFGDLANCFAHLEAVYLIGSAEQSLAQYLSTQRLPQGVEIHSCGTLEVAMDKIMAMSAKNFSVPLSVAHCVLLSPGCASFDQFDDFAARGRAFCDTIAAHGAQMTSDIPDDRMIALLEQTRLRARSQGE